ncbi:hypothetical protein [Ideonella margarita]|uniref:Glycosyl transferase n=1 Tax=Ideonella margarita TaxID=2984191 RepID=A0ABU9BZW7_9BURK
MHRNFCTIFNATYLVRGLALIDSLAKHCPDHRIHVFAMDEQTATLLRELKRPQVVVVTPAEFETPELLRVKPSRGMGEYFWTCTPHIIRHCLQVLGCAECTYVDADVWLLSDPEPVFEEMGDAAVLLTEHRYTPKHDQAALSGRYCVQFMRFVANDRGLAALQWWCDRCIEWCFARREDGKFGDQKYLDDWTSRFEGVHVSTHVGAGIAPWNAGRTEFREVAGQVQVRDPGDPAWGDWRPLVFFHFHGLMSYSEDQLCYAFGYHLPAGAKRWVYAPYALQLQHWYGQLQRRLQGLAARGPAPGASYNEPWPKRLARRLWGLPNTVSLRRLAVRRG